MTIEEKQLLLKDLCARLPYGVKCCVNYNTGSWYNTNIITIIPENGTVGTMPHIETIKPYLRPLSSMTEEEKKEYDQLRYDPWHSHYDENICSKVLNWLNTHHFDFRGLIEKGLALEAPDGMYKT